MEGLFSLKYFHLSSPTAAKISMKACLGLPLRGECVSMESLTLLGLCFVSITEPQNLSSVPSQTVATQRDGYQL